MRRRTFIGLLAGGIAPLPARAQPVRRIGILTSLAENDPEGKSRFGRLAQSLEGLGWAEGRNLQIAYRRGTGGALRRTLADELLARQPDLLIGTSTASLRILQQASNSVPILFIGVSDPVSDGFVASLAQPGGNITGFASTEPRMAFKWYELLRAVAPRTTRTLVLFNPDTAPHSLYMEPLKSSASTFGLEAVPAPVRTSAEIEAALAPVGGRGGWGLVAMPDSFLFVHRGQVAAMAARQGLPAVYALRSHVASGGLISYGVDVLDQYARAATYVDRILRGEKPSNLPVQLPTKFETAVNLRTAKALGIEVPDALLIQADEVIE